MRFDLAINPFGAHVAEMVELARVADDAGVDGVWVTDHFSGAVVGADWSRDPFVCLGAMAATTQRIRLGPLVANMVNRHPAQLASAVNSVQSLAGERVVLGIGSGAAPGSRFAVEHEAIGRSLDDAASRRRELHATIASLRAIWRGDDEFAGEPPVDHAGSDPAPLADRRDRVGFSGLIGVTDGATTPPIVVGASAWPTIDVALAVADGVNVRLGARTDDQLAALAELRPPKFEVSILVAPADVTAERVADLGARGVDRLVVGMSAPYDISIVERLRDRVASTSDETRTDGSNENRR
ncbi:MAG: LLM class flavin-dependent oxidoreductase [Ilumatobacter sp.]|uniref:LLM class flavin-dependent oxidoreductase n=1 Tax=Ilumatobacter sp. TaxID=1967498 RepID=UPI00391B675E